MNNRENFARPPLLLFSQRELRFVRSRQTLVLSKSPDTIPPLNEGGKIKKKEKRTKNTGFLK